MVLCAEASILLSFNFREVGVYVASNLSFYFMNEKCIPVQKKVRYVDLYDYEDLIVVICLINIDHRVKCRMPYFSFRFFSPKGFFVLGI